MPDCTSSEMSWNLCEVRVTEKPTVLQETYPTGELHSWQFLIEFISFFPFTVDTAQCQTKSLTSQKAGLSGFYIGIYCDRGFTFLGHIGRWNTIRGKPWTNFSWQDQPWAKFSTLEVAACHAMHLVRSIAIWPKLELKTQPKQTLRLSPVRYHAPPSKPISSELLKVAKFDK